MPSEHLRGFGTWLFQRKCDLLAFEIERSSQHPALWEKKGASLYTATNVTRYVELRVGIKKTARPARHALSEP